MTHRRVESLALLAAMALAACSPQPVTVTIDPTREHQRIVAWEATARLWEFDKASDRFNGTWLRSRDRILEMMIADGGINRLRLEIRSGAENPVDYWLRYRSGAIGYTEFKRHFYEKIDDNADPVRLDPAGLQFSELDFRVENIVLPAMAIARRHGKRLQLNLCYVDFKWTTAKGSLSHARHPQEYAELIAATLDHLATKYGLAPDALEIILEPDNSDDWRGGAIGTAMVAVDRRLRAAGVAVPAMIAPSTALANRAGGYFDDLARVPGAPVLLSTLAYHRYDGPAAAAALPGIAARAARAGKTTAMLEYVDGDIDDLIADLTDANVSAWQQYAIAQPRSGSSERPGYLVAVGDPDAAKPSVALSIVARGLAQVFAFVDRGAVRIGAVSTAANVDTVGFRNPDGELVVALSARPGLAGRATGAVARLFGTDPIALPVATHAAHIVGLPPGRYRLQRTDRSSGAVCRDEVSVPAAGATIALPEGTVATLYRTPRPGTTLRCA